MNVIGVRQAPDNLHAKSAEEDTIKLYCASRGWPNKGVEFQNSLGEAMARGSIIVAERFATLFPNPSVVVPLLSTALAEGKQVHTCDAGDLIAMLPLLRILCAAWAPLEGKISELHRQMACVASSPLAPRCGGCEVPIHSPHRSRGLGSSYPAWEGGVYSSVGSTLHL